MEVNLTSPEELSFSGPPNDFEPGKFNCYDCKITFSRSFNLKRHMRKQHPNKYNEFLTSFLIEDEFKCQSCSRKYNNIRKLKSHEKRMHQIAKVKPLHTCPLCHGKFEKRNIDSHFETEHLIALKTETFSFHSYDEFSKWKSAIEKDTKCFFSKSSGKRLNKKENNSYYYYFSCDRSGFYKSQSKGIRELKSQGSVKMDAFCPAMIKLLQRNDEFVVTFQPTHVGHENEFAHWKFIKGKFATHSHFEPVLYDVRTSYSTPSSLKLHMLTKQDVIDIEKLFDTNLNEVKHLNNPVYVDKWIDEITLIGTSCVLFYKAQGITLVNNSDLKADDFVVIIMNETQRKLLKEFGPDCVCIDSSYTIKNLDFKLITLLVLDNFQQVFPCAVMISNRRDKIVIELFFSELKKVIGQLKTKIFMSDVDDFYYSSWCCFMGEVETQYYSSWHVDRMWRNKLNRVKSKELRVETYRLLRTLLEERDPATFENLMERVIQHLTGEEEIKEFGTFFIDNYSKNTKYWAYSYRAPKDIDCDMYLEKMHRTFNCMYSKCKYVETFEKIIHVIVKYIRDKLFDRVEIQSPEEILQKQKIMQQKHKISENMEAVISKSEENKWLISSSHSEEIQVIRENKQECKCKLVCLQCNTCVHKYVCSCSDSAIRWSMCKHVHLFCTFINSTMVNIEGTRDCSINATVINNEESKDYSESSNIELPVDDLAYSDETDEESLKEHNNSPEISAERRSNLKRKITNIINSVDLLPEKDFELVEHIVSFFPAKIREVQEDS